MSRSIISKIRIKDGERTLIAHHLKREQEIALRDLLSDNYFKPHNLQNGPYDVDLSIQDARLVLQIRSETGQDLNSYILSISPYKRVIQDYFIMIDSHAKARLEGRQEKLEAIDMGRRGLHNQGAELLIERLSDKIEMDFDTARRFFTLICALHEKHLRFIR